MAKTAVGVNGDVTFLTGHHMKIDRYQLTIAQRLIPTSGYGSEWEETNAGLKFGRFSVSGHAEYDDTATSPGFASMSQVGGAVTFQIAPGCTLASNAVLGDISIDSDINGEQRLSATGVISGAVTEVWDEAD